MEAKTMNCYLDLDGGIAFKLALFKRFSCIEDTCYSEICGNFIEGVHQWADHNIVNVVESTNEKYTGWTISFDSGATRQIYIEKWVMNSQPSDWKHAKNLFNKYLKQVPLYSHSFSQN
jgi:hypothetical protein